jgi:hypothetical protein
LFSYAFVVVKTPRDLADLWRGCPGFYYYNRNRSKNGCSGRIIARHYLSGGWSAGLLYVAAVWERSPQLHRLPYLAVEDFIDLVGIRALLLEDCEPISQIIVSSGFP